LKAHKKLKKQKEALVRATLEKVYLSN
jgi:hypothetical protein